MGTKITLFALVFGVILSLGLTTESISAEMLDLGDLDYTITGGTVSSMEVDTSFTSLIVTISTNDNGQLTITLPRAFIDATIAGADDEFFVISDGEEVNSEEISTTSESRTFMVSFEDGTEEIEFIGTTINVSALSASPMEKTTEEKMTEPAEEVMEETTEVDSEGGGCLIATAAYGSEMAPQIQLLREIRDNQLMNTDSGMAFMTEFNSLYYSFSPTIADLERESPVFKEMVKIGITPMLSTLSIMEYAESDSEVLGYGIGVILLNLGMYFAAPAMIIFKTRKYIRI